MESFHQLCDPTPPPPPPPTKGGGGTYCFWDGSRWRRCKTSCPLCDLNTLWNILMIFGINVEQDQSTCRVQEWQLCLCYFWSYHPFVLFEKISCPLCNSNTLWNNSTVLGRNVEQDQTTCRVQEWQLCLSYFLRYLRLLYLTMIINWFRVRSVSQRPYWIFLLNLVEMRNRTRRRFAYKMTTLPVLLLALSPFVMSDNDYLLT